MVINDLYLNLLSPQVEQILWALGGAKRGIFGGNITKQLVESLYTQDILV